jgi:hypothetical protein
LEKKKLHISKARLFSQHVQSSGLTTPLDVVNWMGAIQAQDFLMSEWAIGLRMENPTLSIIEDAINNGDIFRIHALRPTWHYVSRDDIYWMISLTASKVLGSLKSRHEVLELSPSVRKKTLKIIEKELSGNKTLTRDELAEHFQKNGIKTDNNRLSHILFCAELENIICSSKIIKGRPAYALLAERVPEKKEITRDEALVLLARKYFTGHAPATISDFAWWSNLSLKDIKSAMEFIKSEFISETIGGSVYYIPWNFSWKENESSVHLLPAFDEFLISYRDRSSALELIHTRHIVTTNGIFFPILVIDGQVSGLWQRSIQKNKLIVTIKPFTRLSRNLKDKITEKVIEYGKFLNKEADVTFADIIRG